MNLVRRALRGQIRNAPDVDVQHVAQRAVECKGVCGGGEEPEAAAALLPQLPPGASLTDLIDLSQNAGPEHYRAALQAAAKDRQIDGVLVIFSPKTGVDAAEIAKVLAEANRTLASRC